MLPDFPSLKRDLAQVLNRAVRLRVAHHLGFVGQFPHAIVHEGDRTYLQRSAEDAEEINFNEMVASGTIKRDELRALTLDVVLQNLDETAKALAGQMRQYAFQEMDRVVTNAGQVVDGADKPLPETILAAFEKMQISFDEQGKPKMPQIVCHPSKAAALSAAMVQLSDDPKYRQRLELIFQRQGERWRARQTARKLVG